MNEFKTKLENTALEATANAWVWADQHLKEKVPSIAYEHGVRAGFFLGAIWSREETLKEVIEWLRSNEIRYLLGGEPLRVITDDIEDRFLKEKK